MNLRVKEMIKWLFWFERGCKVPDREKVFFDCRCIGTDRLAVGCEILCKGTHRLLCAVLFGVEEMIY